MKLLGYGNVQKEDYDCWNYQLKLVSNHVVLPQLRRVILVCHVGQDYWDVLSADP